MALTPAGSGASHHLVGGGPLGSTVFEPEQPMYSLNDDYERCCRRNGLLDER